MALEKEDMLLIEAMYNFEVNFFNFETKHKDHSDYFKIKNCRDYLFHYAPYHIKLNLLRKIDPNTNEEQYLKNTYSESSQEPKINFEIIQAHNAIIKSAINNEYVKQEFDARIYNIFLFEAMWLRLEDVIVNALNMIDNKNAFDFPTNSQFRDNIINMLTKKLDSIPEKYLRNNIEGTLNTLKKTVEPYTKFTPSTETLNTKNEKGQPLTLGNRFKLLKEQKIEKNHDLYPIVEKIKNNESLFNEINDFGIKLRHTSFKKIAHIDADLLKKITDFNISLSNILNIVTKRKALTVLLAIAMGQQLNEHFTKKK